MNIDGVTAVIFCELGFAAAAGARPLHPVALGRHSFACLGRDEPRQSHEGPDAQIHSLHLFRARPTQTRIRRQEQRMKELVSKQLVRYLEERGVTHIFGLCGHTNIAVLTEIGKSSIRFVNSQPRAGRRPLRRRLCARQEETAVVLLASGPGSHQCRDRRRHRGAGFHPDGGDRRRHPHPFLRQASASGDQPPCRRGSVRNLSAVRQTGLARGPGRPAARDHRQGVPPWRKAAGPGPVLVSVPMDIFSAEIDTAFFERVKPNARKLRQAVARRGSGGKDRRRTDRTPRSR